MTKTELLAELASGRRELLEAIEGLSEAEQIEPGVTGDWSVKDLLGHIAFWQSVALTGVEAILAGRPRPAPPIFSDEDLHRLNAEQVEARRPRALEAVHAELEEGQRAVVTHLTALDEAAWNQHGPQLVQALANDTYEHEREHAAQIRAWRAGR